MHINRLRLLGFKSFVEPADLVVSAGLTGVVGPNGCGKSNLLEALRWVMGETSYKSMRAAAMDDVIFSGTTQRPARNMAEVTIFIDNSARMAPTEFNDTDTIEITRRIEREAGSAYRINGRDVRARDVKVLFEDAATGARSPALVRQGQIGEIVNAKPEQRRRILEDAAGIAGLHTRRHEAELRLKAAEGNLARIGDVLGQIGAQMDGLKRQARAARRYKDLSTEIRKLEALLLHLAWTDAQVALDADEAGLIEALTRLGAATQAEAESTRAEAEAAAAIDPLREAEAVRGVVLARLRVEEGQLERDEQRARERAAELEGRAEQLARDTQREDEHLTETAEALLRLDAELETLSETGAEDGGEEDLRTAVADGERALAAAEARVGELTHRAAEIRARRQSLEQARVDRQAAAEKARRQLMALEGQRREIGRLAPDGDQLAELTLTCETLTVGIADLETRTATAETDLRRAVAELSAKREASGKARLAAGRLRTEADTLTKLLTPARDADAPPILDSLTVTPGYETALGAALGEDLDAPVAETAPVRWSILAGDGDPALPARVKSLAAFVEAPDALRRRLAQIGIVDATDGARLQKKLRAGQRLVSLDGDLWRWDGYVAAAHGVTPAGQRLAERNRLKDLLERAVASEAEAEAHAEAEADAVAAEAEAHDLERELRQTWRQAQGELVRSREALGALERAQRETDARLAAVEDAHGRAQEDLADAEERLAETELSIEGLDEDEDIAPALQAAQADVADHRSRVAESRAALSSLVRERQMQSDRLVAVTGERARVAARAASAKRQIETLGQRTAETVAELKQLADLPDEIAAKRSRLLDDIAVAERDRHAAADAVATAETGLRQAREAMRAAQLAVATEREARARVEARLEAARTRRADAGRRIRETLDVAPEDCLSIAGLEPDGEPPPLDQVERDHQRLKADRDRLGGVNLQAEEELEALSAQFGTLDTERADVEQAIAKLRGAIGALNREGKKRLEAAFEAVNGHFQRLFGVLFGGGEARLEMIEAEDPLEGGLEIVAKPPGKKPTTLSLLSGGEQTLTALSLIFAVFLTNPSPICVLDEVDAPLDDSNVDRFCMMMESMAKDTETRFLVITHHPMTMSRMDRLFGVTMAERGVSQLVSVDLQMAQTFREAG